MPKKKRQKDEDLLGWGRIAAEIPEVEKLVAFRDTLPDDLPREELRERLLAYLGELLVTPGETAVMEGLEVEPELLAQSVWQLAREGLEAAEAHLGDVTVRDAAAWLFVNSGVADIVVSYVDEAHRTGEAPPAPALVRGGVCPIRIPLPGLDKPMPLVLAIATPQSKLEDLMREMRETAIETFEGEWRPEPGTLSELAMLVHYQKQGKNLGQIAWILLGERFPEIRSCSEEERKVDYAFDHAKELRRLRTLLKRLPDT